MRRFIKYCMGDDEWRDLYSTVWGMMNVEIYAVLYGEIYIVLYGG
jgi:hypothetical protein